MKQLRECVTYNIRNSDNIRPFKSNKKYFLNLFLPSSIKLWNNLDTSTKNIYELLQFRNVISKKYTPASLYHPYITGNTKNHIHISRMRMGLSGLNSQRKHYNFINYNTCDHCNTRIEDCKHYLLECPTFAAQRQEMIVRLTNIFPHEQNFVLDLRSATNRKRLCNTLIYGTGNSENDKLLFDVVAKFILQSKRFL